LEHHFRLQCPQELWVVVCEVSLHRIEELLVRIARELRPALASSDPPLPFADRRHVT
jgi:hypothetical protein